MRLRGIWKKPESGTKMETWGLTSAYQQRCVSTVVQQYSQETLNESHVLLWMNNTKVIFYLKIGEQYPEVGKMNTYQADTVSHCKPRPVESKSTRKLLSSFVTPIAEWKLIVGKERDNVFCWQPYNVIYNQGSNQKVYSSKFVKQTDNTVPIVVHGQDRDRGFNPG